MQKRGVSVQAISRAAQLLTSKMNYRRLKREIWELGQENEFMSNQWDKASPAEKLLGICLKVAEEEIKAEVNKRVLELNERRYER